MTKQAVNGVGNTASPATAVRLPPVVVEGSSFALNGANLTYRFHVDESTGDLISDHFGALVTGDPIAEIKPNGGGYSVQEHLRREFPDRGRGDFRSPAVRIRHTASHDVSQFQYTSHSIVAGKPELPGLPATFATETEATTLIIHMHDSYSSIRANLSYSIFPEHNAIARSAQLINASDETVTIEKLASFSLDLPHNESEYDLLQLRGEWTRECTQTRRKVGYGTQGFGSATGFSSHYNNPFLAIVASSATETHGDVWGMSLVHTGSFSAEVERSPQGITRAMLGVNPEQLSWPLAPGESFTTPECVCVFSDAGIGAMSRKFHRLYRQNLIRSKFVYQPRPVLLNSWEGLYFDVDEAAIFKLAQEAADLGVKLLVLDDGWFGNKHPRVNDLAGLGDWQANAARFPNGLKSLADKVLQLEVATLGKENDGGAHDDDVLPKNVLPKKKLQFGLWVEPEMVNPQSVLYTQHPDWVLHAGDYPRTECRQQLVLNLALRQVQDFIISSLASILQEVPVSFIKWDHNRGTHESPSPSNHHAYSIGIYRVFKELTARFPDVLWNGCASGGGRFDPAMLQYFPQIWTSDNTDALDRMHIQFGTSLVYPASSMGAHVSAVPNEINKRTTPLRFRAHVAMMAGAFGFELNPPVIPAEDKSQIPHLIALAERISPIVIRGDMWRLNLPSESNYPAVLYISQDGEQAVLFAFQIRATLVHNYPYLRLQGLEPSATYMMDGGRSVYTGATLMNGGIQYRFDGGDYDSKVTLLERVLLDKVGNGNGNGII